MKTQTDITQTVEWQQIAPHGGTEAMAEALINNQPANYFSLVEACKNKLTAKQYQTLYNHGSRFLQAKESNAPEVSANLFEPLYPPTVSSNLL